MNNEVLEEVIIKENYKLKLVFDEFGNCTAQLVEDSPMVYVGYNNE